VSEWVNEWMSVHPAFFNIENRQSAAKKAAKLANLLQRLSA
jgi:hypothetical protein